jgi:hypothetical protein
MRIAYVSMVKDEADIIRYQLAYYYKIGIRDFYIIDNGSTDGTYEILCDIGNKIRANFVLISDKELAYWQYQRINRLCALAIQDGCTHVLPVDADELLFQEGNEKFNIYDLLTQNMDVDVMKFEWWYYRTDDSDDKDEVNPFLRIVHRDSPQQSTQTKVIVKYKQPMEICQGNHKLHDETNLNIKHIDGLYYAHFSKRSVEHLRKKVVNLGKAYEVIKDSFYHESSIMDYAQYLERGDDFLKEDLHKCNNQYLKEYKPFKQELFEVLY